MNPWSNPDALPPNEAADLAAFIDARGRYEEQAHTYGALVSALHPQPGERLIDVGCGSGLLARQMAERGQPGGIVMGTDISFAMLDFARRQALPAGLAYLQADAGSLPYPSGSYDGALAARLLLHVRDPQVVLDEVRRVVRPGGRLALLEVDWGTLALDHSDRILTRRIIDWRTDNVHGNNWMGRQLVRRCLDSGWLVDTVSVLVIVSRSETCMVVGSLRRCADLAKENDTISADEHQLWLEEIDERLEKGRFFATMNEYIVVARSPEQA